MVSDSRRAEPNEDIRSHGDCTDVRVRTSFFQRQADVAAVTGRAAETGFERFKVRTSDEYNRTGATASQLFALALSVAPGGAALLGVLTAIKSGEKIRKLAEAVEKIAAGTEKAKALNEAREKADVLAESSAKTTADEFEYLLYYPYYAESGKPINVVYIRDDEKADPMQSARDGGVIEGVPDAMLSRITELGKLDDFSKGVAAFHTVQRHSVVQNPKPY